MKKILFLLAITGIVTAAYRALVTTAPKGAAEDAARQDRMRFFYSFSQMWCSIANSKYECAKATSDVHAVPRVRVDSTLRNLKEFQDTFVCPAGKFMKKETRCEVF